MPFNTIFVLTVSRRRLTKSQVRFGAFQAGDAAEIDVIEIRFTCDKVAKSSAVAAIALPRVSATQADERFPIWRRGTVDRQYDHGGSSAFRSFGKSFADLHFRVGYN